MAHDDSLRVPSHQHLLSLTNPAFDVAHDDRRPASRHSKLNRRESKIGLKSIFGRSKPAKELDAVPRTAHGLRSTCIQESIAELGQWSPPHQSDAVLSRRYPWDHTAASPGLPPLGPHNLDDQAQRLGTSRPFKQSKAANWCTTPLYKALPQGLCHVILPAATISADAILRLNEKVPGLGLTEEAIAPTPGGGLGSRGEKDKKKHRRHASTSADSLEWTRKVFVLTAGYLLQYAGDGHFDRTPEKMLRLGPSSAAFATDAIPGRHWVVRVCSTAEANGTPTPEHRSLFSKLPFRLDKRNTSNLLMVFESAQVMEAWIMALRGAIESLGGKRILSETGRPKSAHHPPERHSKRALMARSLPRLRSAGTSHGDFNHATAPRLRGVSNSDDPQPAVGPDAVDDDSTSNSGVSQDERHLDNLRDHSYRLSHTSSGQRTVVTSAGPSPEASPTREHIASPAQPGESLDVVVRPRPNASDISIRRQSIQVLAPFFDPGQQDRPGSRSYSSCGPPLRSDGTTSPLGLHPTPNFSVPHSSNRRFSHARASPVEAESSPPLEASRLARGKPPPALRATRTLSIVLDQPPSRDAVPERPATAHRSGQQHSPTKYANHQRLGSVSRGRIRAGSVGSTWTQDRPSARTACSAPTTRIHAHASSPHLKMQVTDKALLNRRSMPQLTDGPPPAPPPTRALPPIPQNVALRA